VSKQRAQQGSAGKLEGVRPKQHVTMRRSRARGAREHPPSFPGAGASTCAKTPMASLREDTREKQRSCTGSAGGSSTSLFWLPHLAEPLVVAWLGCADQICQNWVDGRILGVELVDGDHVKCSCRSTCRCSSRSPSSGSARWRRTERRHEDWV
jgi:hypothetical protein